MSELTKEMPKKLGFGCMRLPVTDGSTENITDAAFCEMIDSYIEQGFKYFDTAYPISQWQIRGSSRTLSGTTVCEGSFFPCEQDAGMAGQRVR